MRVPRCVALCGAERLERAELAVHYQHTHQNAVTVAKRGLHGYIAGRVTGGKRGSKRETTAVNGAAAVRSVRWKGGRGGKISGISG